MDHEKAFRELWQQYSQQNPSVNRIHQLLAERGETIQNDHVAFRTFNTESIGLESFAQDFIAMGYKEKGEYHFEKKRLRAKHYEHENDSSAPKIFISELITQDFDPVVEDIAKMIAQSAEEMIKSGQFLFNLGCCWRPINYSVYEQLLAQSEYAAWLYTFGFRANHFTVYVNELNTFESILDLNSFLKERGFLLNVSGGEIKGSRDLGLVQSSTMADTVSLRFQEGCVDVPCCYYEFAERFRLKSGELFNGFIADSADKIFESTNPK